MRDEAMKEMREKQKELINALPLDRLVEYAIPCQ